MANAKISQLSAATTPLAGTEVLPIVQSSATVKVSVANLTSGRFVNMDSATVGSTSSASYGSKLRVDGGIETFSNQYNIASGASTPYEFVNRSSGGGFDFYVNSAGKRSVRFLSGGDVSLTDNIVPATAAKGINFTANTPLAGKTSQLLNYYEEGNFTPTIASATGVITTVAASGKYTKVGTLVHVTFQFGMTTDASVGTSNLTISGLPFSAASPECGQLVLSNYSGSDLGTGGANGLVQVSGTTATHVNRTVNISSRASTFYWWYSATYHTL